MAVPSDSEDAFSTASASSIHTFQYDSSAADSESETEVPPPLRQIPSVTSLTNFTTPQLPLGMVGASSVHHSGNGIGNESPPAAFPLSDSRYHTITLNPRSIDNKHNVESTVFATSARASN